MAAVGGVTGAGRGPDSQPGAAAAAEIRVLLVDDDALVRAGLSMMLDGAGGLVIVGEAADGDAVPAAVAEHRPDVVLMDLRIPAQGRAAGRDRRRDPQGGGG
jgi:DNA-binding NarL/FixJ family response regulator